MQQKKNGYGNTKKRNRQAGATFVKFGAGGLAFLGNVAAYKFFGPWVGVAVTAGTAAASEFVRYVHGHFGARFGELPAKTNKILVTGSAITLFGITSLSLFPSNALHKYLNKPADSEVAQINRIAANTKDLIGNAIPYIGRDGEEHQCHVTEVKNTGGSNGKVFFYGIKCEITSPERDVFGKPLKYKVLSTRAADSNNNPLIDQRVPFMEQNTVSHWSPVTDKTPQTGKVLLERIKEAFTFN